MTPEIAKHHEAKFVQAIEAIERLPKEDRAKALVAAWKHYGLPVQLAFHRPNGLELHATYGHMLRAYGQALGRTTETAA